MFFIKANRFWWEIPPPSQVRLKQIYGKRKRGRALDGDNWRRALKEGGPILEWLGRKDDESPGGVGELE
ncbi:hypothetical protein TNCV_275181 [Trichonephila clavipes]|nr:hypothetical protein TNCV_275181 [Trichonephila clavipes]